MKDAVGQELVEGCMVAFATAQDAAIIVGVVKSLTPKGVRILYMTGTPMNPGLGNIFKGNGAVVRISTDTKELQTIALQIVRAQLDKDIR